MTAPTDWTPPPPGDTREQLPDHILALLTLRPYLSTACQTGQDVMSAAWRHDLVRKQEQAAELLTWNQRLHQRCRLNNKFTGMLCECPCHLTDRQATPPSE